jgi:hypothetical protein
MTRLIRFVSHLVLALAAGKALAISGAYDAGGGASIPLPAGEWVVHSDKSSADYGRSGQVVVLGPAAGQTGDVVGILAKYTRNNEAWRGEPGCYKRYADALLNVYGTKPSDMVNKCSRLWGSGNPVGVSSLLQRWELRQDKWSNDYIEGMRKIPVAQVVVAEIELRKFNGRNINLILLLKAPTAFKGAPAVYYSAAIKTPLTEWLSEWIELYTESLQAAFQFRSKSPQILALGFSDGSKSSPVAERVSSSSSAVATRPPTEPSLAELLEGAREGDPNREALEAAAPKPILPTPAEEKTLAELLEGAREGDPNRENLALAPSVVLPLAVTSDDGSADAKRLQALKDAQELAARQLAEQEALEQQRLAIEEQAKKQLAAQQQLEQERLALAKQKDSISAELAAMRQMLAELKKANEDSARAEKQAAAEPAIKEPAKPVVMARRRALVIGNDNYKNVSKLDNAVEDAKAMSEALEGLGYKVDLHANLTERAFKRALRNFRADLKGGEEVLFFYAGHGVQLGNSNYLLPVDLGSDSADQVRDESIELQRVLDDIAEQKTKFALAVIDACRDNPFKQTGRAIGGRGLAPTTAATGQMVMFSAGAGQQALDKLGQTDSSPNGLFTRVFLDEMKKPGIPVDRVLRNVRQRVVTLARSVGHEQVPALYDQAIGEFYFKPK